MAWLRRVAVALLVLALLPAASSLRSTLQYPSTRSLRNHHHHHHHHHLHLLSHAHRQPAAGDDSRLVAQHQRSMLQQHAQVATSHHHQAVTRSAGSSHGAARGISAGMRMPRWKEAPMLGRIPLALWQTYRTANLPTAAKDLVDSWRRNNPGLILTLHDDAQAARFVNRTFTEEVQRAYDLFPLGVMKADFWRYAILYARGGVYADVDVQSVTPLSTWLPPTDNAADGLLLKDQYAINLTWDACSMLVGLENDKNFCQWTFAGAARHPVLEAALHLIVARALAAGTIDTANIEFVHQHTGPTIWSEAIIALLRERTSIDAKPNRTANARAVFDAIYSDTRLFDEVRRLGLCVVGAEFMRSLNVNNQYGSQKGIAGEQGAVAPGWEGWHSWVEERMHLRKSGKLWERR